MKGLYASCRGKRRGTRERNGRKTFRTRVKKVVEGMSELKRVDCPTFTTDTSLNALNNWPAVDLRRVDLPAHLPSKGTGRNQFVGNAYDLLGFSYNVTLTIPSDGIKRALVFVHLVSFKKDNEFNYVDPSFGGTEPVDDRYQWKAFNKESTANPGSGAKEIRLLANDGIKQKYIDEATNRLSLKAQGKDLANGFRIHKTWTLDTRFPEGSYAQVIKRFKLFVPCKRRIDVGDAAANLNVNGQLFKNPTYLMVECVELSLADNVTLGIKMNWTKRTVFRDL